YSGDHWSVVRSIADSSCDAFQIRIWICSAGFGLIRWQDSIGPYSATFARSHPDSVTGRGRTGTSSEWWNGLTHWIPRSLSRPDSAPGPRNLSDLGRCVHERDFVIMP